MAKHFRYLLFLFLLSLGFSALATTARENGKALPVSFYPGTALQQDASLPEGQMLHAPVLSHAAAVVRAEGERSSGHARDTSFSPAGLHSYGARMFRGFTAERVTYGAYAAHATGFLRRLLYPKHSFW